MSNSRRNRTRGDLAGSADAPLDDFNTVLSRIEKYVIGISHEMQTLNGRLEDYGQQINHNSQSILNIEKKLKRKNVRKYRHSPAICHGIRRYAGRTTHKRVKKSNAFEMKDVQKTALKKRLSIECKEKEKEDLTTEQQDKIPKYQETSLSNNIEGLAASNVDTIVSEELAASSQDEGTFHFQDTGSSDIRNEETTSSIEPAEELVASFQDDGTSQYQGAEWPNIGDVQTTNNEPTEEQVTDMGGDETSRTEDTSPLNDMDEVATSDISPSDIILVSEEPISTEQDNKTSQNQETNPANNRDGPTASSVDITEELAGSSQDEETSEYQSTESSNIRDAQTTSKIEPTEEQITDIREDETSSTEDTSPSNDTDDASPSDVLLSDELITSEPDDKTSQNQATNSPNNIEGPTASNVDTRGNTCVNGEFHEPAMPSRLDSQIIPPERLSSFHHLALGENSVLGCDKCVPSEESVHLAKNRMVWKLFAFGDYNTEDSCKSTAKSGNNTKKQEVHTKCKIVTSVAEFLPLQQIAKFEDNNGSSSNIKQREDVVQNIRDKTPDFHQKAKSDVAEDKSASHTRQAKNSTARRHDDCSNFGQQTKSNKKDQSAPSIKPRASLTSKGLDKYSGFHGTKADKRCESSSRKSQKEYLSFKLERDISNTYFYERTSLEKKDASTARIKIQRGYISPRIRGDFSDSHLRSKQDEEEVYAPRQRQTGDLSHLVDRKCKNLIQKLQNEFDDWEKMNRRRGTFG